MASNREKLVNLIVANSNLEPSEATELIEEYTNNVADNEVENLINAMTEALGTKVGNKLDANGIKEVFDIAREHSNIKTDQEVAEEQARKQAIDEKQARRTEKAYDIIDQRRAEKSENEEQRKARFLENKKIYTNLKINRDKDSKARMYNSIMETIEEMYSDLSDSSKKHLAQKELFLFEIEEIRNAINESEAVPEEKKEETTTQAVAEKKAEYFFGEKATDEDTEDLILLQGRKYKDCGIDEAIALLELKEQQLRKATDPKEKEELERKIYFIKKLIDREAITKEELLKGRHNGADFLDEKGKIGNSERRIMQAKIKEQDLLNKINQIGSKLGEAKTDEERHELEERYLSYLGDYRLIHARIELERVSGEEIDLVLSNGIEDGTITEDNYDKEIEAYGVMRRNNEINSCKKEIQSIREKMEKPNISKEERMELLNEMYLVEQVRLAGTITRLGFPADGAFNLIQKGNGLTRAEIKELNEYKKETGKVSEKEQKRSEEVDELANRVETTANKLCAKGYKPIDIVKIISAIQETRASQNYARICFYEKENGYNSYRIALDFNTFDLSEEFMKDFYAEFTNNGENLNALNGLFKNNNIEYVQALAELRNNYRIAERNGQTMIQSSNTQARNISQSIENSDKGAQTRDAVLNITSRVKKEEMEAVTAGLAKDKSKTEITGQEQSETQTEIET